MKKDFETASPSRSAARPKAGSLGWSSDRGNKRRS
jgi:hypothetical protein